MSEQPSVPSAEPTTPVTPPGATHDEPQNPNLLGRFLGSGAGRNLGLIMALLVLFGIGAFTAGDRFTNFDNVLTIIRYASIIGVLSIGMTFVIIGGGIDLSVGSVMGLGSVVATLSVVQALADQMVPEVTGGGR